MGAWAQRVFIAVPWMSSFYILSFSLNAIAEFGHLSWETHCEKKYQWSNLIFFFFFFIYIQNDSLRKTLHKYGEDSGNKKKATRYQIPVVKSNQYCRWLNVIYELTKKTQRVTNNSCYHIRCVLVCSGEQFLFLLFREPELHLTWTWIPERYCRCHAALFHYCSSSLIVKYNMKRVECKLRNVRVCSFTIVTSVNCGPLQALHAIHRHYFQTYWLFVDSFELLALTGWMAFVFPAPVFFFAYPLHNAYW